MYQDHPEPAPRAQTRLLRLGVQGLQIDIESREGFVVDLVVSAQQQEGALWRRLLQHVAHALRSAANACDSRHDERAIRVTEVVVLGEPVQDQLPDLRDHRVFRRWPSGRTNGQTHYQILAIHEGIEDGEAEALARFGIDLDRRKGANDFHPIPPGLLDGRRVIVLPAEAA
jgi:hypothetical protein